MAVYLGFDAGENLVPEVHFIQDMYCKMKPEATVGHGSIGISTVFSTGVENSGERPNVHGLAEAVTVMKDADSNTKPRALTPSERVR